MSSYLICRQCGSHNLQTGWHDRHTVEIVCLSCGTVGLLTGFYTGEGDSMGEAYQRANIPGKGLLI